jgi:predicted Zn finger-like uncharacterized protein
MAAQYKTKCPHCAAQFKIGVEQLKQAKGKVRCGSCLEVFLATQNLVDEAGRPVKVKQKSASGGASTAQSGQQQPNRQAAPKQGQDKQGQPRKQDKGQGGEEQQARSEQQQPDPAQRWTLPEDDSTAASQAEQPGKEEDKDAFPTNNTAVSLGDSEISESLLSMDEDGGGLGDDDFTDAGGGGDTDESWAEQLLEELEDDDAPKDSGKPGAEPPSPENMSLLDEWPGDDEPPEEARRGQRAPEEPSDEDTDPFSLDMDDGAELDYIDIPTDAEEPEPRKSSRPRFATPGTQWLKWSSLSVLALIVLAAQVLAFRFGELARTPEWRPLYAQICELAGCALPGRSNIDELRGANLVVRSHPEVDNALVVDAIFFNEADYPQPFPDLELTFSSLDEEPLASRRFTPDEYRAGELEDRDLMPPDVPVHVSFEILDPGPDAVNYSLRFHPPAPTPENTEAG